MSGVLKVLQLVLDSLSSALVAIGFGSPIEAARASLLSNQEEGEAREEEQGAIFICVLIVNRPKCLFRGRAV